VGEIFSVTRSTLFVIPGRAKREPGIITTSGNIDSGLAPRGGFRNDVTIRLVPHKLVGCAVRKI
jgi:hypothetical protein